MLIIWRGWGIVAIPVFIASILVCTKLCDALFGQDYWDMHNWPAFASIAVAGGALIGLGKLLGDGHEFFFIPVKIWGGLCISACMFCMVVSMVMKTETRDPSTVTQRTPAPAKVAAARR